MNSIIIGSTNRGKINDFTQLFAEQGIAVKSLLDFPEIPEVDETGTTFHENAILKAETISKHLNKIVIADDSGLEVEALAGRPGVYSARYAGLNKSDEANMEKVLSEMKEVPWEKRQAAFICVLAVAIPHKKTVLFEGKCSGIVTEERKGDHGFGYDPIFYVPGKGKTMAELTTYEKNTVSHRKKALEKLSKDFPTLFKNEL